MTKVTSKNFSKSLAAVATAFGSVRDNLQVLVVFALLQYSKGNFTYITELANTKSFKGLALNGMMIYICAFADVKLDKIDGVYKFVSKKTTGYKYVAPTVTWFEHNADGEPKVVVPATMLAQFIKRIEGALSGSGNTSVAKKDVKSGNAILVSLKAAALKA